MVIQTKEFINMQDIVMLMPGNVYWKNIEGNYVGANNNFIQILGFNSFSELKGKNDYELLEKKLADKVRQNDQQVITTNKPQTFEEIGFTKGRSKATYVSIKAPLHSSKGDVMGILRWQHNL